MAREQLTTVAENEGDPWLKLGPSSYRADGEAELLIPWREVGEDGALRLVRRVRPWQTGAKQDETGADPDTFTLTAVFNDDVKEIENEGQVMWPDTLEALVKQFKTGKTATLNLPWKRGLRVKPKTWQRRATSDDNRGGESLTVTMVTDNEDSLDREAFEAVSVKANVKRAAEEAVFALEQDGMSAGLTDRTGLPLGIFVGDVITLAEDLAGLMNRPGEFAQAIVAQAMRLRSAAKGLVASYSTGKPGRDQMSGPDGASARAKLFALMELAANAEGEARAGLPKTRTFTAERRTSVWDIATELGQNARKIMAINSQVEDFSNIEKGAPILVFAE